MKRVVVPVVFLALACSVAVHAAQQVGVLATHPDLQHALLAAYGVLRTAVAVAFAAFTVERAQPVRRSREPLAFVACAAAMAGVVLVSAPPARTAASLLVAGDAVAVVGCSWLLASVLVLGRCFGVLPEARGFVLRGPYRLVRHPVYLGEIVAVAGLVLAAPVTWNVIALVVLVSAQLIRTHYEERALEKAFPAYAEYAARTGRLLPRPRRVAKPVMGSVSLIAGGVE
jgi:protein-S-isoprenylcysteine O-methyltransferase Ste14